MSAPDNIPLPKRAVAAFYGRTYDKNTPFYGQDAKLDVSYAGQRLKQQVTRGLLNFDDVSARNGPWTWSKAHTLLGDKTDRDKYSPHSDPLQMEDRIPVMKGWDQLANAYALEAMKDEMEHLNPADPVQAAKIAAFAREVVKGKKHAYEEQFHDEFVHRFREWLRGNGSEREYLEAGMESYVGPDSKRAQNKPISDHPTVLAYLSQWQNRVIDYNRERTVMKLRMGRRGPYGEAASLDDLWKYYKFVVYGVESSDDLGVLGEVIKQDREKKPNVAQGPLGATQVKPATPKDDTAAPFVVVPLQQTPEEQLREAVVKTEPVAPPAVPKITATIVDHEKEKREEQELMRRVENLNPKRDELGDEMAARLENLKPAPPEDATGKEMRQRLERIKTEPPMPAVPKTDPPPPDDSVDKELDTRVKNLAKEPPKPKLPKMPAVPKTEPVDVDAQFREHVEKLREDTNTRVNRASERAEALQRALDESLKQNGENMTKVTEFFERLVGQMSERMRQLEGELSQALQRVVPPAVVPPTVAPPPVAAPPAPTPPAVPPAVVPPTVAPTPPAPTPPVVSTPAQPQPDLPVLHTIQGAEPVPAPPAVPPAEPMPIVSPNHAIRSEPSSGPVKKIKPEEISEATTRASATTAVQRMGTTTPQEPSPGEQAAIQFARDWNGMLTDWQKQLPAATEAASKPDATPDDIRIRDFILNITQQVPPILQRVQNSKSVSEQDRQLMQDLFHVPFKLSGSGSGSRVIIADQTVSLRRSSSQPRHFHEQLQTSRGRSLERRATPQVSPARSPAKRPEPEPSTKLAPITNKPKKAAKDPNAKKRPAKSEKDEKGKKK